MWILIITLTLLSLAIFALLLYGLANFVYFGLLAVLADEEGLSPVDGTIIRRQLWDKISQ